ncbi:MAG: hypothetical protein EBV83_03865 [Verrucomicrobia bacterium]|nr:hypothetical protein [Verrucomicrobiota bacterium]
MKKRAIVGVGLAGFPEKAAGNSWAFLQWGLGLRDLGWDVWLVESLQKKEIFNAAGKACPLSESVNLAHWKKLLHEIGWDGRATLLAEGENVEERGLREFAQGADLFLNLSGHFKRPDLVEGAAARVYVDLDPVFTQIWAKVYQSPMNFAGHNGFWSVGLSMGRGAVIPDTGHAWKPVLPPVCRRFWTADAAGHQASPAAEMGRGKWTTVTHWYGYAAVEWEGREYGNKATEFAKLLKWPERTGLRPCVVTDLGKGEEKESFMNGGWEFLEPGPICSDWREYRAFLAASRGEFSPAKSGYVIARTGWFSDRSVLYLSLGRPVLLQETGWSRWLPEGLGLVAFENPDEAVEKAKQIEGNYEAHQRAALSIAAEHLDATRSIPRALAFI